MSIGALSFWIGLIQIIGIDIVLSGDNAVVIALACRGLPRHRQKWAIGLGAGGAVVLRVLAALVVFELLALPYVKLLAGLMLLWVAHKLGRSPQAEGEEEAMRPPSLAGAVWTILLADAVMSLDNVVAIAGAARGSIVLLVLGLAISIPLVIYGSTLMLRLIARFPVLIVLGAGLIGWVAGDMIASDGIVIMYRGRYAAIFEIGLPILGILIASGRWVLAESVRRLRGG